MDLMELAVGAFFHTLHNYGMYLGMALLVLVPLVAGLNLLLRSRSRY